MAIRLKNLFGRKKSVSGVFGAFTDVMGWGLTTEHKQLVDKIKGWSYACIDRNVGTCSQVPIRLYKSINKAEKGKKASQFVRNKLFERIAGGYELEEVETHAIHDIIRRPNPYMSFFELKQLTFASLETTGNAYWKIEKVRGEVQSILPLMPQFVTPKVGDNGFIKEYKYGEGISAPTYSADVVIHFKYPSLKSHILGEGPMQAAGQAVDLLDYMNRFEIASFKTGGCPGYIMLLEGDAGISDADEKRMLSNWRTSFAGVDKSQRLYIGRPGVKDVKPFGLSPKEMSYTQGRKASLEEICGVFGVPTSFVLMQEVSRANALASIALYNVNTIMPKLAVFENKVNEEFVKLYGDDLYLLFDDPTPKDSEFRLKERESNIRLGYTTINEERAMDGLEPVEWGDEPRNNQPAEQPIFPVRAIEPETKKTGPKNDLPKDDFVPTILKSQLVIFFEQMVSEVARKAETQIKSAKSIPVDVLNAIFDSKRWTDQFKADVMPFVKGLLRQGIIDSLEKVNPEAFFNANAPEVLRALEGREGQITTVIDNSRTEIRKLITEGIEDGLGPKQIARNIRGSFDTRHHAETVARTETIWAHNEGTVQGWKQSGVVAAKQWDTAPDERRCEFCGDMHGRVISLDANFYGKGDTMEGREGGRLGFGYDVIDHPPLHPNCRCSLIPILIED